MGIRSGTENVPYIMGLSRAIQLNQKEKDKYVEKLKKMQEEIIEGVMKIPDVLLTGSPDCRVPNHTSFCFKGINGKMLIKELSKYGLEVSSGSACSSPKNTPSHVLEACGISADYLYGGLRVTLGKYNNMKQVKYFLKMIPKVVEKIRKENEKYNNESIFISKNDFIKKIESGEDLIILDVRPVKFPRQQIPGSVYIPPFRLNSYIKKINKNKEVVLVCFQGDIISPQIQQKMVKLGYKNVKVLKGGLFNYFGLVY